MNTFLAYPNYRKSAQVIDSSRLGNQAYRECKTLINGGWEYHPVAKMWKGYEYSLAQYALACFDVLRNERDKHYPEHIKFFEGCLKKFPDNGKPKWLGYKPFHDSHKSKLLFKGRKDALWLSEYPKIIGINNKIKFNKLSYEDVIELEKEALTLGYTIPDNWYKQFKWDVPDNLYYMWFANNKWVEGK